ncbi:recombinase family protein [Novosphingobium sp. 2637]|uniref:Recombinase family protein n=1 Tax=Novosphingobium mangrovi (ex Hu et al. 2023) TaxID=2930094 RepID=A0ABT0A934_9SPHN|nr:recombinase family protein [Novosphingobium mangrovi (ex Hu et al. 2023)]
MPGPRGKLWQPSSLNGMASRGAGIIRNRLYIGELVWNKVRMVKDPQTGRRVSRPNPESEWHHAPMPELRIVSDEEFYAAHAAIRQIKSPENPNKAKRPTRFLSGLLKCGACGSGMSVKGMDKASRQRINCSAHKNSRSCPAPHTFYLDLIEELALQLVTQHLNNPDELMTFAKAYEAERKALLRNQFAEKDELDKRLIKIEKDIRSTIDFLIEGIGDKHELGARTNELAAEKAAIRERLAQITASEPKVTLMPATVEKYAKALKEGRLDKCPEPVRMFRDVITEVVVSHDANAPYKLHVKVNGHYGQFTAETASKATNSAVGLTVVAEEGLEPPTRGL